MSKRSGVDHTVLRFYLLIHHACLTSEVVTIDGSVLWYC